MPYTVTKDFRFEAAHSLPHLPRDHTCHRLHGHSYRFRVEVTGEPDERGFVVDYAEISADVNPIVRKLDHQNLNDLFDFPTTAENLAKWLFDEIRAKPFEWTANLSRIVFYETAATSVVYSANKQNRHP